MAGSLEVPAIGSPNSTQDPKVKAAIEGLNAILNSDNTVMGMQSYRNILASGGPLRRDEGAGTFILAPVVPGTGHDSMQKSGANLFSTEEGNVFSMPPFIYFDDADYVISGKTLKMRLRAQVAVNATKAAIKFTFGLYPITVAGGSDILTMTLGSVVSSSTVEINEPAASTVSQGNSGDFTIPSDGAYALGVVTSATLTNLSAALVSAQLQVRNV